jgi:glycine dehydrogenase subunit 1
MLKAIGVSKIEDLFNAVPAELLKKDYFNLPSSLSEQETREKISNIAKRNQNAEISFLGGGCYSHYIPSHVMHLAGRSEFYTAYTPYQPEISQGILQGIFEYQSMITRLTAMDATNASMYDGSTASAEVCLMATEINQRKKILVSKSVHPHYREVMKTYCNAKGLELVEVPFNAESGKVDKDALIKLLTEEIAGVFIQSPNFFGVVEDMKDLSALAHGKNALSVQIVTEALSLGLLTPPGENDVDIAVGDGQSFGIPVGGGGPSFGFLATTEKYMRKLPGRIIGETEDLDGNKAYVLTLQAREQHIRREKASSNICTNQGWCALIATIYLATLGQKLKDLALLNHQNSLHFQKELGVKGLKRLFSSPFFNEFVVDAKDAGKTLTKLRKNGIDGGLDLGRFYPELKGKILVCVTELITQNHMDKYIQSL